MTTGVKMIMMIMILKMMMLTLKMRMIIRQKNLSV